MRRDEENENKETTLIFLNMLGFAALTEEHPHRIEDDTGEAYGSLRQNMLTSTDPRYRKI